MRAEVAKVRYLPTPRWTAAAALTAAVLAGVGLFVLTPDSASTYVLVPSGVLRLVTMIAAPVFGAWIVAVEFSAGTLQRTLTAESSRSRVLAAKGLVAVVAALVTALAILAASGGLSVVAAAQGGVELDRSDLARSLLAVVPGVLAGTVVGFGSGLLTRSMAGGVTTSLALVIVLDGALSFIPGLEGLSLGSLRSDLSAAISGTGDAGHGVFAALVGLLFWLVLIVTPGWIRFVRGDLK